MQSTNTTDKNNTSAMDSGGNALKEFQLSDNQNEKSQKDFGDKIVLLVEQIINSGYFTERNDRITINRNIAAGRMDMNKFKDFFNLDGKVDFIKLNWKAIMDGRLNILEIRSGIRISASRFI